MYAIYMILISAVIIGCAAQRKCEVSQDFLLIDQNDDCMISYNEWNYLVRQSVAPLSPSRERDQFEASQLELFGRLDRDKNKFVDSQEWNDGSFDTIQNISGISNDN